MTTIELLKRIRVGKKDPKTGQLVPETITYDSGMVPCLSWVLNFLKFMELAIRNPPYPGEAYTMTDTDGSSRYMSPPAFHSTYVSAKGFMECDAVDSIDEYGIVIGTSDVAEDNSDTKLQAQILDGIGSGQMEYEGHTYETTQIVGSNVDFEYRRTFTNNSGATIGVKEIGIYVKSQYYISGGGSYQYFCIAREVITTVNVDNGDTLEVIITMRTTV